MRHISRTHRVNIAWLKERFDRKDVIMKFIETQRQAADIYTKHFTDKYKWFGSLLAVNHYANYSEKWLSSGAPIALDEPNLRDATPYVHKSSLVHSFDGDDIIEHTINKPSDYADADKVLKAGIMSPQSNKKNTRRLKKANTT